MASRIKLNCVFAHERLTELLQPRVAGQRVSEKIVVEEIRLGADAEWLHADTRVSGTYNGWIDVRYKLDYDSEHRSFRLNELHVELVEKGLLARGANWFVQKFFSQKIDQKFEQLLNEKFHDMLSDLLERYSDHTLDNGLSVKAKLEDIAFEDIHWDQVNLYCTAISKGSFTLEL